MSTYILLDLAIMNIVTNHVKYFEINVLHLYQISRNGMRVHINCADYYTKMIHFFHFQRSEKHSYGRFAISVTKFCREIRTSVTQRVKTGFTFRRR